MSSAPHDAGNSPTARRAVVVGGGISGLCAALELRRAGLDVTVVESSDRWGGCLGVHEVAGLALDSGAESFATRSDGVRSLLEEVGLDHDIVTPHGSGAWVQLPEGPKELPKAGVLGIPSNPWDAEVRSALGLWGSFRASLDRYLPVRGSRDGRGSEAMSVAALVRARMGKRVLERLVTPVVGGVHSADPALLDVDMVAPGLRDLMARQGSLAAAVAAQRERSAGGAKAGSAVAGLRGGMNRLVKALVERLAYDGVELVSGERAERLDRVANGWRVGTVSPTGADAGEAAEHVSREAEFVVVALGGPAAVELLSDAVPELGGHEPVPGPEVKLVTLVLDKPELDARPRGTGVLVAPQVLGIRAKALTHATSKWAWLADEAGPGTHVLRLSYGRAADPHAVASGHEPETDDELFRAALADASALLTVPIAFEDVLGWDVVRWEGVLPFATVGHRERVREIRRLVAEQPGLAVVGGWAAGNGLAAVVPDARSEASALASRVV